MVKRTLSRHLIQFFCLLFVSGLIGCGVFIPMTKQQSKLTQLEIGMTKKDTWKLLGKPEMMETSPIELGADRYEICEYFLYRKGAGPMQAFTGLISLTLAWWIPQHWFGYDEGTVEGSAYELYYVNSKLKYWMKKGETSTVGIPSDIVNLIHYRNVGGQQ